LTVAARTRRPRRRCRSAGRVDAVDKEPVGRPIVGFEEDVEGRELLGNLAIGADGLGKRASTESLLIEFGAFCRTQRKAGSYAQDPLQFGALGAPHMQLEADFSGPRKEELKNGY